jgi:hypothetical protein
MRETAPWKGRVRQLPDQPIILVVRSVQNKLYRCASGSFSAGRQTSASPSAVTS